VKLSKRAWTYVFFDLFFLKISIIRNLVSDTYVFFSFFFFHYFLNGHGLTWFYFA